MEGFESVERGRGQLFAVKLDKFGELRRQIGYLGAVERIRIHQALRLSVGKVLVARHDILISGLPFAQSGEARADVRRGVRPVLRDGLPVHAMVRIGAGRDQGVVRSEHGIILRAQRAYRGVIGGGVGVGLLPSRVISTI